MGRYIVQRLVATIPTMWLGATVVFLIVHVLPGDPAQLFLGDYYTGEAYQSLLVKMGLDQPLYVQYFRFLKGLLTGDLGNSFRNHQSVSKQVLSQLPYTAILAVTGLAVAAVIGVATGILSAVYRNKWPDQLVMLVVLSGVSMPNFLLAIVLILIFSVRLDWLPIIGGGQLDNLPDLARHLVLPMLAIGWRSSALIARLTRASFLEVLGQDFVRTARAKGLKEQVVLVKHTLRNALLPVVTVIALNFGTLLGGSTVIEKVFNRPGIGKMLMDSVLARDYPVVQGTVLVLMFFVMFVNLLADLALGWIDPRVRYG